MLKRRSMSRRNFIKTAGVTSAAGLAIAHNAFALAQSMEPDPSVTGTLTWWGHADHPLENIRDAFLLVYPNVNLDWQFLDDFGAKYQTAMAAGTGAPDLFWAEADMVQQFGGLGVLLETTDIIEPIKDDLVPGKLQEAWIESRQGYFGMPGDLSVSGIYYNAEVLESMGITITDDLMYDEFIEILNQIAAAGKNALIWPAEASPQTFEYYSFFNAQFGGNGPVLCDNSAITLNDEASVQAVQLLKNIYDTGTMLEVNWLQPEYWDAISREQLVLALAPAWERGFWESNIDEAQLGKWRLAPLPRAFAGGPNTGIWGGATLIAKADTAEPELAKRFMVFAFGSMEGSQAAADWGIIPPYLPFLEGPYQESRTLLFGDQNVAEVLVNMGRGMSTDFCRPAAFGPILNEFLTPRMNEIIEGGADVKTVLDDVAAEFEPFLIDYQV
jgi:ABC-type glycerol-3-phosphate transport system substrate-binding protein